VLQSVAECCRVLQCVAGYCRVLQCVAECCSVLQCITMCCTVSQFVLNFCSMLQCVAAYCSVLQCDLDSDIHEAVSLPSYQSYGVALVSRIDKIIGLFCKRALQNRRYSAKDL